MLGGAPEAHEVLSKALRIDFFATPILKDVLDVGQARAKVFPLSCKTSLAFVAAAGTSEAWKATVCQLPVPFTLIDLGRVSISQLELKHSFVAGKRDESERAASPQLHLCAPDKVLLPAPRLYCSLEDKASRQSRLRLW
jgi:hypothetical protein